MQANEIIGVVGVLVLTSCLIALYHLIGKVGRHNRRYGVQTKRANNPEEDRQPDHDRRRDSGKDDGWLLWGPELDDRVGQSKPDSHGPRETRRWLRS
jgi:hypothetical protein